MNWLIELILGFSKWAAGKAVLFFLGVRSAEKSIELDAREKTTEIQKKYAEIQADSASDNVVDRLRDGKF